jgi:outer membrane lipoprotein LolB
LIRTIFAGRLAALVFALSGCATNPPLPVRPSTEAIVAFSFSGRIAVRQGETRHHAKLDWHHDSASDEILVTTPLGQGVAEITRDASGAHLLLADRRRFSAADWGELSQEVFGFRLPLQTSTRWLLGNVVEIEGWRIRVIERESIAPDALPTVIELEGERDDITVRLKIDEWGEVR